MPSATSNDPKTSGVEPKAATALNIDSSTMIDPFASQVNDGAATLNSSLKASPAAKSPVGRRLSADEWDASKTPPSQFQKRKGSVYATPGSRDSHLDQHKERDQNFHNLADKMKGGLFGGKRKSSKSEDAEKDGAVEK